MFYRSFYDSPLGRIVLESDGEFLTKLCFANDNSEECADLPVFRKTMKWLEIYFGGGVPDFLPKYRLENLTPFRKLVIEELVEVPHGATTTYGEIAETIARKKNIAKMSAQAVGNAVGWNPICLIIPCHRVVGTNNNLTGYAAGIDRKIKLLELEGHDMENFCLPKPTSHRKLDNVLGNRCYEASDRAMG